MKSNENKKKYSENGYVLIPSVFNKSEVHEMREAISNGDYSYKGLREIDFFLENKSIYKRQFNEKILKVIEEIFGCEYEIINDINIQSNLIDNTGRYDGWHIDAGSEFPQEYLFSGSYGVCKVGVYLQDNSRGIDVEVGGHKRFKNFGKANHKKKLLALLYYYFDKAIISNFRKKIMVPLEAGDVLIFDSRLPHRSSPALRQRTEGEPAKIVIYWQVAKNQLNSKIFLKNAMKRAVSDENSFKYFMKYLGYFYPGDYPAEYCDEAKKNKIIIRSLSAEMSLRYKMIEERAYNEAMFNSLPLDNELTDRVNNLKLTK